MFNVYVILNNIGIQGEDLDRIKNKWEYKICLTHFSQDGKQDFVWNIVIINTNQTPCYWK